MTGKDFQVDAPPLTEAALRIAGLREAFFDIARLAIEKSAAEDYGEQWSMSPNQLKVTPYRVGDAVKFILDSGVYISKKFTWQQNQHVVEVEPPPSTYTPDAEAVIRDTDSSQIVTSLTSEQALMLYALQHLYLQETPQPSSMPKL